MPYTYDNNGRVIPTPGALPGTAGSADPTISAPAPTPAPTSTVTNRTPGGVPYNTGAQFAPGGINDAYTPVDESAIREKARREVQMQIDAINEISQVELAAARQSGAERLGQTRALSANTGVIGSPMGDAQTEKTRAVNSAEERAINAATGEKIASILAGVNTRADTLIQNAKTSASKNATDYSAYLKDQATQARTDFTSLAATGVDLSSEQRQKLLDQTGYDSNTFDQLYKSLKIANATDIINKDKPQIVGNKAIFFKQTKKPDGTVSISQEVLELPVSTDKEVKQVVARDDGMYVFYTDNTWEKVGEPSNQVLSEGQSLIGPDGKVIVKNPKTTSDGSNPAAGYNDEFAATIEIASQFGGTQGQRDTIKKNLEGYVAQGDYKSAYRQILNSTADGLGGEGRTKFNAQIQSYEALAPLARVLKEYSDEDGNMNIFKGKVDDIGKKIGVLTTDPKYAALGVRLEAAFQQYRQNMTGAAFGEQESAEYQKVVPSKNNTLDLNLAVIDGAKQYLNAVIESNITSKVGEGGVYIKQYAEGATPPAKGNTGESATETTTRLIGPNNVEYDVPNENVDAFIAAGGKRQ